jgi:hypothetical protein
MIQLSAWFDFAIDPGSLMNKDEMQKFNKTTLKRTRAQFSPSRRAFAGLILCAVKPLRGFNITGQLSGGGDNLFTGAIFSRLWNFVKL